jgi:hypothetical protein
MYNLELRLAAWLVRVGAAPSKKVKGETEEERTCSCGVIVIGGRREKT